MGAPRRRGHLLRALGVLVFASTPAVSCGARSWLPGPPETLDASLDAPPDAAPDSEAESCMGVDVPIVPNVPNLYFVLDVSGSMNENMKWPNVQLSVASLIGSLKDSAEFGATVFPDPSVGLCAPGVELMPLHRGDPSGRTAVEFLTATTLTPRGGTPTAATFRALVPRLRNLPNVSFVILATDGGPNCNSTHPACSIAECTSNIDMPACATGGQPNCCQGNPGGCLDGTATAQAISDLFSAGVRTYVMGIPGSAPYGPTLDALAVAGGTARTAEPRYYAVDTPDTTALGSALGEIAREVMKSCRFLLEKQPVDPNKVNVYVDGVLVPSDGSGGWSLQGSTVTLAGGLCGTIQTDAAAVPMVRVSEGCPTVH